MRIYLWVTQGLKGAIKVCCLVYISYRRSIGKFCRIIVKEVSKNRAVTALSLIFIWNCLSVCTWTAKKAWFDLRSILLEAILISWILLCPYIVVPLANFASLRRSLRHLSHSCKAIAVLRFCFGFISALKMNGTISFAWVLVLALLISCSHALVVFFDRCFLVLHSLGECRIAKRIFRYLLPFVAHQLLIHIHYVLIILAAWFSIRKNLFQNLARLLLYLPILRLVVIFDWLLFSNCRFRFRYALLFVLQFRVWLLFLGIELLHIGHLHLAFVDSLSM